MRHRSSAPIPTSVFIPAGQKLPAQLTYPPLPQPVTLTRQHRLLAIGRPSPQTSYSRPFFAITDQNGLIDASFEFEAGLPVRDRRPVQGVHLFRRAARLDQLPRRPAASPGTCRRRDGERRPLGWPSASLTAQDFTVEEQRPLQGRNAAVADVVAGFREGHHRSHRDAVLHAAGARRWRCDGPPFPSVLYPGCLRNPAETATAADGSNRPQPDPGSYCRCAYGQPTERGSRGFRRPYWWRTARRR